MAVNPYFELFETIPSYGEKLVTLTYLHGPNVDQILAEETADGAVHWALTDHQGSVRDVIDNSGNILNRIVYDSFGQVTSETNPDFDFRFGYTGRERDDATGLMYYRARYYDPTVGRFISEDPLGFDAGDANFYRYVFNSPTNFTDPSGKFIATLAPAFTLGGPPGWAIGAGIVVVGVGAAYLLNRSQNTASSVRSTDWDFSNAAASNAFPSITATDPREFDPNRGALTPSAPIDLPNNTAYPQPDVEGVNDAGPFGGGFCEDLAGIFERVKEIFPTSYDPELGKFVFDSADDVIERLTPDSNFIGSSKPRRGESLDQYSRTGGQEQAINDFIALDPTNVRSINKGLVGELDNGDTAILRDFDTYPGSEATIEIQKASGDETIKLRYFP